MTFPNEIKAAAITSLATVIAALITITGVYLVADKFACDSSKVTKVLEDTQTQLYEVAGLITALKTKDQSELKVAIDNIATEKWNGASTERSGAFFDALAQFTKIKNQCFDE